MRVDWTGVLVALLVAFLTFFILFKTTDITGFCLDHNIPESAHCMVDATEVMDLSPLALFIALTRPLFIPILSFALGMVYYFKGHPIKKWTDVLLPCFVIGFLSGLATLVILIIFQSMILYDLFFLFTVLSWIGFFIGIAVFCAVVGGLIVYLTGKM